MFGLLKKKALQPEKADALKKEDTLNKEDTRENLEMIAVLAALCAYLDQEKARVKVIKRALHPPASVWNAVGRKEAMDLHQ